MRNFLFAVAFSLFFPLTLLAQDPNLKMDCGTDQMNERIFQNNPHAFESWLKSNEELISKIELKSKISSKNTAEDETLVIPVVVHVIHNDGEEKISVEQVKSQFEPLNFDYRRVPGTPGFGTGVDMNIEFCLASKDPKGQPTNGVVYVKSPVTELAKYDDETLKKLSRWDPNKYLNVYIVKAIGGAGGGGVVLGYAFFPMPDNNNKDQDGVVINYNSWGISGNIRPGTNGRVAPHEFGHYLNLFHPFQDGCTGNSGTCQRTGDWICDTPPSKGQNFGTPERLNTCGNETIDLPDNTRNYMDYTDDDSKDMFTPQQRVRVRSTLDEPRYYQRFNLYSESNNKNTGVGKYGKPTAHFWSNIQRACSGQEIKFIDYSFNKPENYFWSFPGGNPSTSTEKNPVVKYPTPGVYSVTLKVLNNSHPNDTSTNVKSDFIFIRDTTHLAPFKEGFERKFPPADWQIINEDFGSRNNGMTFTKLDAFGGFTNSTGTARIRFYYYNGYGQRDYLVSPNISLKGMKNAKFSFALSYRPQYVRSNVPMLFTDSLAVWVSKGCEENWNRVYYKGGQNLATIKSTEESVLIPNKTEFWRTEEVDLTKYIGDEPIRFRFEAINGYGNNLFIDDVEIVDEVIVSRDEIENPFNVTVSPNPFEHFSEVQFRLNEPSEVSYSIFDLQGREIQRSENMNKISGDIKFPILIESAGVYILKLKVGDRILSSKIINIQ